MGKLIMLLLIVAVIGGAAWYFMNQEGAADAPQGAKDAPRVEEKYGFTSQGAGG